MNAHKAISARLASFAGLTALVSTRVYPDVIPSPAVWPAVTYHVIHTQTAKGALTDPPLSQSLIQVDVFDKTRSGAVTAAAQVRLALDRWRQTAIAGVTIDDCLFVSEMDLFEPLSLVYQVSADFRLFYRE